MVPTPYQNHEHGNYRQSDTAETLAVSPGRQREANLVGLPDPAYAITGGPGGQQFGSGRDGQDTFVVSCPSEPVVYDPNQVTSAANRSNPQAGDPCHTLPGSAELPILALGFNHQEQQNFRAEAELTNPKRVGQTEAVCVQLSGDRHDPGVSISEEQTFTLSANPMSDRGQAVAFQQNTREEVRLIGGDGTLCGDRSAQAGAHQQNYVAGFLPSQGAKAEGIGYEEQMAPSPKAGCHDYGLLNRAQVRRLLPEEREALQGFPRGYTQIPYKGKPAADGPRYKSLGNSMAVPVVLWIGQRIQTVAGQPTPTDGEEV